MFKIIYKPKIQITMKNFKKFNVVDLSTEEMFHINGGSFWKVIDFFSRATFIQDTINDFVDGWNSVKCGCQNEKKTMAH